MPNKALQRTRISVGCLPWRSGRAAELGRYAASGTTASALEEPMRVIRSVGYWIDEEVRNYNPEFLETMAQNHWQVPQLNSLDDFRNVRCDSSFWEHWYEKQLSQSPSSPRE